MAGGGADFGGQSRGVDVRRGSQEAGVLTLRVRTGRLTSPEPLCSAVRTGIPVSTLTQNAALGGLLGGARARFVSRSS